MGRGTVSRALLDLVGKAYGLELVGGHRELEESFNLNVVVRHGEERLVVRVYRPSVTAPRLEAVQRTRQFLLDGGLPFAPLRRTLVGSGWCEFDDRLIEVEEFVPSETYMKSFEHIRLAVPMLARVHNRLRYAPMDDAASNAPMANHVDVTQVVDAVSNGLAVLRTERLTPVEQRYVAIADQLSHQLWRSANHVPRQLVHGDFWDDNVRFTGSRISLITDLDFMGHRPRIDDLALTLFYTNERLGRDDLSDRRRTKLRELVDAYDEALDQHLSGAEREALPYAIARTPLCFAAQVEREPASGRDVLANRGPAWSWAWDLINNEAWRSAFVRA